MRVHFRDDDTVVIKDQAICRSGSFPSADHRSTITLPDQALEHAADHFSWLPITLGHDSAEPIGSTMNATYRDGAIHSDLLLWDPAFIKARATQISPGGFTYSSERGHISEIKDVNHLALVKQGRLDIGLGGP